MHLIPRAKLLHLPASRQMQPHRQPVQPPDWRSHSHGLKDHMVRVGRQVGKRVCCVSLAMVGAVYQVHILRWVAQAHARLPQHANGRIGALFSAQPHVLEVRDVVSEHPAADRRIWATRADRQTGEVSKLVPSLSVTIVGTSECTLIARQTVVDERGNRATSP